MKKTATRALGITGAVFVFSTLIMSCSEPPPRPEEEVAAPQVAKPPATPAPQSAVPRAEPAEPVVQPLVAWIEAEPEEGEAPLKVQFTARLKGGTLPYKLQWVFGDDSEPTSEANPVHTYTEPGSYFVELTANDSGDDDDDDDIEIVAR